MDISVTEFKSCYQNLGSVTIIDIREKLEFQTFNIGGYNIPLGILLKNVEQLDDIKNSEIIVICQRGLRSETAKRMLTQHGYTNVRNMTDGLMPEEN